MSTNFVNVLNTFDNITKKPESFISAEANHSNGIKSFVKGLYDFIKNEEEISTKSSALPELIVDEFDLEQIWQQIELQNEEFLTKSLTNVSKFVVGKKRLVFNEIEKDLPPDKAKENVDTDSESDESTNIINSDLQVENGIKSSDADSNDNGSEIDNEESEVDDDEENNVDIDLSSNTESNKFQKRSIVDDEFFKLDEMNEFLRAEEKVLNKQSKDDSDNDSESNEIEEEVDFFESGSEIEDEKSSHEKNPRYKDFFRSNDEERPSKRVKFMEEELSDTEQNVNELKSRFELRQERLENKIKILEDKALSEKPWQLLGEITAENRPQNSLLQEIIEFDVTTRPAPVITEKTTFQLEDIIRQRIKDRVFDSVERKVRPVENLFEYKKSLVLNQEKSKESLARIYENDYIEQREAIGDNFEDKEEEDPELHKEINKMMRTLFKQLDALSNFHFTPKTAAPEVKIVSNLPAINMEEVAPVAASDATLLAPEEVKNRIKGDIIGKSERGDADKNRQRRMKKRKQRIHAREKKKKEDLINKINPGLGNRYSKEKAKQQLEKVTKEKNVDKMDESHNFKSIKSSTAFFKQLEEEAKAQVKVKTRRKTKQPNDGISAKKLKL